MAKTKSTKTKSSGYEVAVNERRLGMKYCPVCELHRAEADFSPSSLTTDGYLPVCILHLATWDAKTREQFARTQLAKAGIHPESKIYPRYESRQDR